MVALRLRGTEKCSYIISLCVRVVLHVVFQSISWG